MTTHFQYPPADYREELSRIANAIVVPGKGILPIDERASFMESHFSPYSDVIKNSEETRRQYRQLLLTADPTLSDYVSAVVMIHETLYQKTDSGVPFRKYLKNNGILIGIKVDKGLVKLWGSDDEHTTPGLDDLGIRCLHYKRDGCDFAKCRCVFKIGETTPSYQAISLNANKMGRFASICQSFGMVALIKVDVLPDGDHDLLRCQQVTETVLAAVFKALNDHHVYLEGVLLIANMVYPGASYPWAHTRHDIAEATVNALRRTVPAAVPGIFFLSGGLSEEKATIYLNAINNVELTRPWTLSFAFGRALQASVLHAWGGRNERIGTAQTELLYRLKANSLASLGKFTEGTIPTYSENINLFSAKHDY